MNESPDIRYTQASFPDLGGNPENDQRNKVDIQQIFQLLSDLKMEVRKCQSFKIQRNEISYNKFIESSIEHRKQADLIKGVRDSIQKQLDLYEIEDRLCPFNPKLPGQVRK